MRNTLGLILLFIGTFFGHDKLSAQEKTSNLININIKEGLSQSQINCLLQDKKGFIWVGTQDGLNKYDGYGFKVYRHNPLDSTSISSNNIQALQEDKDGNLWLGTRSGLNKFDRKSGKFFCYFKDPYNPYSLSENNVNAIMLDRHGFVWVKTSEKLDKLDPKTGKFTHYEYYRDVFNQSQDNKYFTILEDYKGNIWLGTKDGLNFLDPKSGLAKRYFFNRDNHFSISDNDIHVIFEDREKRLFIGTANGLNIFNKKRKNFDRYYVDIDKEKNALYNCINDIFEDEKGKIWLGTDEGILFFDKSSEKFTESAPNYPNMRELKNLKISKIMQDYSHIFWIGTWESGLYKIDSQKKKFKLYKNVVNKDPNLLTGGVASIYLDSANTLWVGNWGSGLVQYNRTSGKKKIFTADDADKKICGNFVHVIFKDSEGKIWLGTRNGVSIFLPEKQKFYHINELYPFISSSFFNKNRVNTILEDKNKNIWLGTQEGLYKFDYKRLETFNHNINDRNSLCSNEIYTLLEDDEGFIWIGTPDGLDKYDPINNKFFHYKKEIHSNKGLSNNTVQCLHLDKNKELWIGTESGLNKYNKKDESFTFYIQKEEGGFTNDFIYGILEEKDGDLWISTNRGIAKFNPKNEFITNYDLADGLQAYEFNFGACFKAPNGEFFFGGVKGLNSFFPDSINKNQNIPKLSITSLEKYNKTTGKTKIYIDEAEEIVISPKDYLLTIEFAALEFNRPEKNQYAYMMEGLDDEWINIGTKHYATFSQIPPGEYTFRVKGSNNDLIWNEEGVSVKVIVKSPWYKSKLAYASYIILVVSCILLLIQWRTKKFRKSVEKLKEKERVTEVISKQKEELSIKNQNLTDSMNYAQRIILAMMPSIKLFHKHMPESFILYLPKDIVSGDFFWFTERNGLIFVATVDCTGHGIPGAFMSIIGFDLLRNITKNQGIENPAEVLNKLSSGVTEIFRDGDKTKVKDGMELALCVIDKKKKTIEYAGAKRPLYLIRNNNIIDYKADRFSVGLAENMEKHNFKSQKIGLKDDDVIYIFSDGYADQFGGPRGKKFKYRRFRHLLLTIHKLPMEQQKTSLEQSMKTWRGEMEQVDDILLVGIKPLAK